MRMLWFARRCTLEMLRDKVNVFFGLGFPLGVLLLLTAIQANIPVSVFELPSLTPGIAVFGLSFVSLFSATLISRDRSSSFMARLLASPLTAGDFILGYTLPMLPLSILQTAVCYIAALILGMGWTANLLLAIVVEIPAMLFFIGIGLLCGAVFGDKQVGGVCGALLTNLTAFLSGTWFDVKMVGGVFESIANVLPFVHAVNASRAALSGDLPAILPELWWVIGWAAVVCVAAVLVFRKKMRQ